MLGSEVVKAIQGAMPRPKAHYSLIARNHVSGNQLKVELIDLPFTDGRRFRLRVNGEWANKVPVASKSLVLQQVRGWLVRH
jgi:hypothetical protein